MQTKLVRVFHVWFICWLFLFVLFFIDCWITEVGIKHKHFSVMIFQVKKKGKAEVEDKFYYNPHLSQLSS